MGLNAITYAKTDTGFALVGPKLASAAAIRVLERSRAHAWRDGGRTACRRV